SAPPEVLAKVEALIAEAYGKPVPTMLLTDAVNKELIVTFDPKPKYLDHIRALLPDVGKGGLHILADPMYGAGRGYVRDVLAGSTHQVSEIRGEINPAFPGMHNPEPIPRNLEATVAAARESKAQVALCTDGDADRIGIVDGNGNFVNQLE